MKLSQQTKRKLAVIGISGTVILGSVITLGLKYDIAFLSGFADVITYPFKKGIYIVEKELSEVAGYFNKIDELLKENEQLGIDKDRLIYENTILEQYRDENNQLKGLLDIAQRYREYPQMGANIIAKDPGNWYKSFTIDKGKGQGVAENDVILAGGGLVGHIIDTEQLTSQVISIIDDRSSVSAKVVRTGDTGILKGDIELSSLGLCRLEIDVESEIVKGDQIVTSHLSQYPPGIPIGVVEEVTTGKNGLTQYAYVRPFVDFNHLQNVLIILNE